MYRAVLRRGVFRSSLHRRQVQLTSRSYHSSRFCNRSNYYGNQCKRRTSNIAATVGAEPFLSGSSGTYVEAMYESWLRDRNSVHKVDLVSDSS